MLAVDVALSVIASPDPAVTGSDLTYVLSATNLGSDLATGVAVSQDLALPPGVRMNLVAPWTGTFSNPDPTKAWLGNWVIPTLAAGETTTLTTVVTVEPFASPFDEITYAALSVSPNQTDTNSDNNFAAATTAIALPIYDWGDAPDTGPGTGPGNYRTSLADNGPRHRVVPGLYLGARVDIEAAPSPNAAASGDDIGSDDEDGVLDPASDLRVTAGQQAFIRVWAVNDTGKTAYLNWWIDLNRDGVFDNSESSGTNVEPQPGGKFMRLPLLPVPLSSVGTTYLRMRLTTESPAIGPTGPASDGEVEDYALHVALPVDLKISERTNVVYGNDVMRSGSAVASLGDLDGDGIDDLAVGSPGFDESGEDRGAVWIQFLNADGVPKSGRVIRGESWSFPGTLDDFDRFGSSLASLGDLDADGVTDLVIGAPKDDDGDFDTGAVWITYLNTDGTVKRAQKISATSGGFGGSLAAFSHFGASVSALGDLDRDGVVDIAVGAPNDPGGGFERGAVWILFLNRDGTVKREQKIAHDVGGFGPFLADADLFGSSVTSLGDFNRDGSPELLIGAPFDDGGGIDRGAVWIVSLTTSGTVFSSQKISQTTSPFLGALRDFEHFGSSATALGDINGDGFTEVAVGAPNNDEGGRVQGAVWLLSLQRTGGLADAREITDFPGGFDSWLLGGDEFGSSMTLLGDLDGDGIGTLAVGAAGNGRVWMLDFSLSMDLGDAPDTGLGSGAGNYQTLLTDDGPVHLLPTRVSLGTRADAEANGQPRIAANGDDLVGDDEDGLIDPVSDLRLTEGTNPKIRLLVSTASSSVSHLYGWIDYNRDGLFDNATERASAEIPPHVPPDPTSIVTLTFPTVPRGSAGTTYARFRISTDSAAQHATGWARDGEVEDYAVEITAPSDGALQSVHILGLDAHAIASLGDLNGDGVSDLALGTPNFGAGGTDRGAVFIYLLSADGTIQSSQIITHISGGFGSLADGDSFGRALVPLGDLDGDGVMDLAVGAPRDDTGGDQRGTVYVLLLNANGTVKASQKIGHETGGFGMLNDQDQFGGHLKSIGDLDGDGVGDLAVTTPTQARGAVHILLLNPDGTVKRSQKIGHETGGFGTLAEGAFFGSDLVSLGDLDGDGVTDLAVGAVNDTFAGSVYVLLMNADGTVRASQKIAHETGGFGSLSIGDSFGARIAALGDLDGNGVTDLAVQAYGDDTGGPDRGALYILLLNPDGTVKRSQKIAHEVGGFGQLSDLDAFGYSPTPLGDLNGDGIADLAVGALWDDTGGLERGAVYVLLLDADGSVKHSEKIAHGTGGLVVLSDGDRLGSLMSTLGDINGDGIRDLAVRGGEAIYMLHLAPAAPAFFDYGDAPTAAQSGFPFSYPTTLADDGPRHEVGSLILGVAADVETDGRPSGGTDGDDLDGPIDDEDGVELLATLVTHPTIATGSSFSVQVTLPGGKLDAWIDFNHNGVFDHPAEHLGAGASIDVHAGLNIVPFTVPAGALPGPTFARFRLSSAGGLLPTGYAPDGEVEDHIAFVEDGNLPERVNVQVGAPIAGNTYIVADGDDAVVRYEAIELFRSRGSLLGNIILFCTPAPDTIHLENLASTLSVQVLVDGYQGSDTLILTGAGHFLEGPIPQPAPPVAGAAEVETIDITGSGPNTIRLSVEDVLGMSVASDTLRIRANEDDTLLLDSGWRITGTRIEPGAFVRIAEKGSAKLELIGPHDWTNPVLRLDVNGNGTVEPLDVLIVINELNTPKFHGSGDKLLAAASLTTFPGFFYDTSPDGFIVPLDVLVIINFLNAPAIGAEGDAVPSESERYHGTALVDLVFANWQQLSQASDTLTDVPAHEPKTLPRLADSNRTGWVAPPQPNSTRGGTDSSQPTNLEDFEDLLTEMNDLVSSDFPGW